MRIKRRAIVLFVCALLLTVASGTASAMACDHCEIAAKACLAGCRWWNLWCDYGCIVEEDDCLNICVGRNPFPSV